MCVLLAAKDLKGQVQAYVYPSTRGFTIVWIGKCVISVTIQLQEIVT